MYKNIVAAVDDSTHAKAAVEYAAYLAGKFGARLELLHVVDWRLLAGHFITHFDEVFRNDGGESFRERVEHYYQSYGERLLEEARARAVDLGVRDVIVSVEIGSVAKKSLSAPPCRICLLSASRARPQKMDLGFWAPSPSDSGLCWVQSPASWRR